MRRKGARAPRKSKEAAGARAGAKRARKGSSAGDLEAVRRAVAGTLNREVPVEVQKQPGGEAGERWAVTMIVGGVRAPAILVSRREMDAMRQVPLVPAHLRGHFLRNYVALENLGWAQGPAPTKHAVSGSPGGKAEPTI